MWSIAVVLAIAMVPLAPPPHVSCVDGHIVEKLSDCPPVPEHRAPQPSTGHGGSRGLLGLGIGGL